MANPYSVTMRAAADDGTNTYCLMEITDGTRTMPVFQVTFPTGTTAAAIRAYMQTIANNQPTVAASIGALINSTTVGA